MNFSDLLGYQRRMNTLLGAVRSIDLWSYESAAATTIASELQPRTIALVAEANALVSEILTACEVLEPAWEAPDPITSTRAVGSWAAFEHQLDATVEAVISARPESAVADVAFVALVELRQRASRLHALRSTELNLVVIGSCDSALRCVAKALCALDRAIAHLARTEPLLDFVSELELSLRVRRAYHAFRARILAEGEPSPATTLAEVEARLRAIGHQIAVLVGLPIYPSLRFSDRRELRGLQQRVLAWFRQPKRELAIGQSIWQDLHAFAAMLLQVNRREELVTHDAEIVRAALEAARRAADLPEVTLTALQAIEGRDLAIDALLEEGRRDSDSWLPELTRVSTDLGWVPTSTRAA